jgi:hypothetical protein
MVNPSRLSCLLGAARPRSGAPCTLYCKRLQHNIQPAHTTVHGNPLANGHLPLDADWIAQIVRLCLAAFCSFSQHNVPV